MSNKTIEDQTIAASINTELRKRVNSTATHIDLFYRGLSYSYNKNQLPVVLGRDTERCDIQVDSNVTSRTHCTIELQDDQIGIRDTSKNGTYIKVARTEGFVVKQTFYPLLGQGAIQLGSALPNSDDNTIMFKMRAL